MTQIKKWDQSIAPCVFVPCCRLAWNPFLLESAAPTACRCSNDCKICGFLSSQKCGDKAHVPVNNLSKAFASKRLLFWNSNKKSQFLQKERRRCPTPCGSKTEQLRSGFFLNFVLVECSKVMNERNVPLLKICKFILCNMGERHSRWKSTWYLKNSRHFLKGRYFTLNKIRDSFFFRILCIRSYHC